MNASAIMYSHRSSVSSESITVEVFNSRCVEWLYYGLPSSELSKTLPRSHTCIYVLSLVYLRVALEAEIYCSILQTIWTRGQTKAKVAREATGI